MDINLLILIDTKIIGGPGKGLFQLLRHLPNSKKISCTLCNFQYAGQRSDFNSYAKEHDLQLELLEQKSRFDLSPLKKLRKIITERKINLIQSHGYKTHLLAFLLSRTIGIPWIAVAHGWTSEDFKVQVYHLLDKVLLRFADEVITVSPILEASINAIRTTNGPSHLIYNAIDPEEIPRDLGGSQIRKACGIDPTKTLFGVFGRLSHEKGVDILIEAFATIVKQHDAYLLVVGHGPDLELLENRVQALGIDEQVFFHGHQTTLGDYYEAIDALVIPSRSEGLPNVLLEAMACDVPVISSDVGAVSRVIRHLENGVLIRPGDVPGLVSALDSFCSNMKFRGQLASNAKKSLFPKFSAKRRANSFYNLYCKTIQSKWGITPRYTFRRFLKNCYLRIYTGFKLSTNRIKFVSSSQDFSVLCYHRVNDQMRDLVTVGIDHFEEQIAWLAKHCDVFPLQNLLNGTAGKGTGKPVIAITFDDGYLDNYEHAAPILERYRIHATFFVSTGIVNTEKAFPHDLRRIGHALPTMTWDNMRDLVSRGFSIGSHTVNHINCTEKELSLVEEELKASQARIFKELKIRDQIFAYPYGGREDCTDEIRRLALTCGYLACCSAYGGSNESNPNCLDIKRLCVDYRFNSIAFRARALGYSLKGERSY